LSKLVGSISGEGKPTHVEDIAAEKRDREYKLKKSFVQITRDEEEALIFAELATTADQNALATLIGLLRQLSDSTKKSLNADEAQETESVNNYNKMKASLNADNVKLVQMIADQDKNQKTYDANVKRLTTEIAQLTALISSKEKERAATKKEQDDKKKDNMKVIKPRELKKKKSF